MVGSNRSVVRTISTLDDIEPGVGSILSVVLTISTLNDIQVTNIYFLLDVCSNLNVNDKVIHTSHDSDVLVQ